MRYVILCCNIFVIEMLEMLKRYLNTIISKNLLVRLVQPKITNFRNLYSKTNSTRRICTELVKIKFFKFKTFYGGLFKLYRIRPRYNK